MHLGRICTTTIPANSPSVPPTPSFPSLCSPFSFSRIYNSLSPIRADCVCTGMGPLPGTRAADQWPRMQRKTYSCAPTISSAISWQSSTSVPVPSQIQTGIFNWLNLTQEVPDSLGSHVPQVCHSQYTAFHRCLLGISSHPLRYTLLFLLLLWFPKACREGSRCPFYSRVLRVTIAKKLEQWVSVRKGFTLFEMIIMKTSRKMGRDLFTGLRGPELLL